MKIRVIDLETTGLSANEGAKVCEIGWCDLFGETVSVPDFRLINPGIPVPPEASAVHHLIDADLADAPAFEPICARVIGNPEIKVLAAHKADFERQWVWTPDGVEWICTLKCAQTLWPDAPTHSNMGLRYWLNPDGLDRGLANLAHRAAPDAYVTAFILRELLKIAPVERLIEITANPVLLPRCQVGKWRGKVWAEVDKGFLEWMLTKSDFDADTVYTVKHELNRRKNT